jgi:hypothetical protein
MSNPFKTKEFKDLQKIWNKKLERSGFEDIERKDSVGARSGRLKTHALKNIVDNYTAEEFAVKEEYYRLAGQFLHEYKFKSDKDKTIWRMHSEGISYLDIIKALKKKGVTAYKDLVQKTIERLAEEMKNHVRQS